MSEVIDIQKLIKDRDKQFYKNKRFLLKMHEIHKVLKSENKYTETEIIQMIKVIVYRNTGKAIK